MMKNCQKFVISGNGSSGEQKIILNCAKTNTRRPFPHLYARKSWNTQVSESNLPTR